MHEMIHNLYDIGALQFGSFTLKSGVNSPFYVDLRRIISYPSLLKTIAETLWDHISGCQFDLICGVPYTALPIATTLSIGHDIPMVLKRKEIKKYGTRRLVEGVFKKGQTCLVIEDVVTSGASLKETLMPLEHEGLKIKDLAIILDRDQGGVKLLKNAGYRVHSLITIHDVVNTLQEAGKLSAEQAQEIQHFVRDHAF